VLNLQPPAYVYCPFCGGRLQEKPEEGRVRPWCPSCDWTYYPHAAGSVTAVVREGNQVLLVKRRHEPFAHTWMFPAGFIDFGEHPREAVRRELLEETGLIAADTRLMGVFQSEDDPRQPGHFVFFFAISASGELIAPNDENEEIRWFDLYSAPRLSWLLHQRILDEVRREMWAPLSALMPRGRARSFQRGDRRPAGRGKI
jgi:ADP-ribose pyrophosphatase YjhB (NUDIX family)